MSVEVYNMMDITLGQVVYSKAGRDKDSFFLVVEYKQPFVYLVDGKLRRLENPKKKKEKHIHTTKYIDTGIRIKLELQDRLTNADIRKSLSYYIEEVNQKQ
jgi:ribosomal protein L14E/L6E/L27E